MMRDSQATFERAQRDAAHTLRRFVEHSPGSMYKTILANSTRRQILEWISELEALTRALYQHLNERDGR